MPIYDVEIPGKGSFEVESPTELSDEQAYAAVLKQLNAPKPERSWGEALLTDPLASLASGIGGVAQLPGQIGQLAGLVKPEETTTGLMGAGKDLQAWAEKQKSEALRQKQAALQADVAKQEGFFNEASAAIKGTLSDPALLSSFLLEQVPNMIGGLGGGMITRGAVKTLLADATETALQKAAVRGAVGTNAAMQGADVGSGTYEQTYENLIAKGMDPTKANEQALTAAREAALGAATASLGAQFLIPGGQTLEKAFLGRKLPGAGGLVKGLVGEGGSEAFEEGAGQFLSNLAQSQYVPETDLMKGVGQAAGLGGVLGGIMGGAGGVSLRGVTPAAEVGPTTPTEEPQKEVLALEDRGFKPVVFPDGTVGYTPEQVKAYEQQQFEQKFDPQVQFAKQLEAEGAKPLPALPHYSGPTMYVMPDGSTITSPEELKAYQEQQFQQKFDPQVQFAKQLEAAGAKPAPQLPHYTGPTMYVMPDGSTISSPEELRAYEQKQFEQRISPEVQFAKQLEEQRAAEEARQQELAQIQQERQATADEIRAADAEQTALNEAVYGKTLTAKEQKMLDNQNRQFEQRRLAAEKEAAKLAQQENKAFLKAQQQELTFPQEIAPTTVEEQPDLFAPKATPTEAPLVKETAGKKANKVPESVDATGKQASWVIRDKETGAPVHETWNPELVKKLNTEKYEAVPIAEHLAGLNKKQKLQLREAQFSPAVQQSAEAIRAELTPFLDKIGLGNVGLRLVDSINNGTADGAYFRNAIEIALDAKNPLATLRHETIHALKELGVFTDQEWAYLSKMAKEQWIDQFISKDKQGQYRTQYAKDNGSEAGFDAYLQEEAIAEAFRSFGDKPKAGIMKRIVNKLKAFFDATGNWFRGNGFNSVDSIFSGVEAGRYAPKVEAAVEPTAELAPKFSLRNAPPKRTTKLSEAETAGKAAMAGAQEAWDHLANQDKRTSLRMKLVDVAAPLADRLAKAGLPVYDDTGRLRADMLNHAKNQAINLIKNMMISGQPMVNTDGTLGIERSDKTLARSQQIADSLDNNQFVKDSGLSGRAFVAEVARALRGKDILADDVRRNAKGRRQLEEAKARYKEAKAAAAAGKHRMYKELMRQVAELRRDGYKNKNLKREKMVDQANIDWAEKQLKNVPEVGQILDIWRVNNHALVNLWEQVGLLTAEQADEYRSNVHYVPLFKSAEDLNEDRAFPRAGIGGKSTPKMHKLEGGVHEVNVWENIDKQFARMVALAYENQTRSFAGEQLVGVGGAYETNRSDPNVNLRFKRNGRDVHLVAENPNDVAAFQSMGFQLSPIMKAMAAGTKVLRYGALINPMFWLRQLIRDPIHATMVTNTMVTPFHSTAEFAKILFRKESDAYRTLVERGVIGEVGSTMSIDEFIRTVGTEADKKPGKLHNVLHRLMQIHESSDAATRVAIYESALKKAKAQGMSDARAKDYAVYTAREAINFSVQGNNPMLANLRAMIPFLSASITSLDTVYKAATGYGLNKEEKRQVQQLFMRRAAIFTAMTFAYAMMYQDDDDYKNVPDYIRDNNWLLPMASPSEPGKKVFIKIPLPFEIGFLLKTIPEASIRYMAGTSTGKEVLASYLSGLSHNLPSNGILIPQLAKPILENVTNHSFYTGKPIESIGEQRLPVGMRGTGSSEFAKQLGGAIGYSPKMIDNLINGYFAEAGSSVAGIASYMIHAATGTAPPSKNFEEIWGIKSFVTSPNTSKAIADFYQIDGQAQQTVNEFNELKKTGDYKAIEEFVQDPDKMKQVAAQKSLDRIADAMGKLRAQIRLIERNQTMSPEERRKLINQLQQQQSVLAQTGVSIAEQIGVR